MSDLKERVTAEIMEHLMAENAQDLDALLEGMTDDCFNYVVPDPNPMYAGPVQVAERYRGLWRTFPDLKVEMRHILWVSETHAFSEHTLSGTQEGPLFGAAGTGKFMEVPTAVIWDIVDGRVRGETVYFDVATMYRQAEII